MQPDLLCWGTNQGPINRRNKCRCGKSSRKHAVQAQGLSQRLQGTGRPHGILSVHGYSVALPLAGVSPTPCIKPACFQEPGLQAGSARLRGRLHQRRMRRHSGGPVKGRRTRDAPLAGCAVPAAFPGRAACGRRRQDCRRPGRPLCRQALVRSGRPRLGAWGGQHAGACRD
jgi:hypothetical protein